VFEGGDFGVQDVMFYLSDFAFVGIGALVAARRSENPVGWLFIAVGMVGAVMDFAEQWALTAFTTAPSFPGGAGAAWVYGSFSFAVGGFLALTVLYFPTGRLPSPPWRWVARLAAGGIAMSLINAALLWRFRGPVLLEDAVDVPGSADLFANICLMVLVVAAFGASVISLLIRFRRANTQERQQIKWLAYAGSLVLVILLVGFVPALLTGSKPSNWTQIVGGFAILAMPASAAIGILRYRLFDVDVIINRTLVYGALTALLALMYFAAVAGVGGLMRGMTDKASNDLVIAASTLAVAALFRPLRARLQRFIDRCFYRQKYDATKTVEAFSARLRDEVDLETMRADLVAVVQETMQPTHASVWLRHRDGLAML
jgi:hypothetical protein